MAYIICGQTATPRLNFPALKITSELFLTSSYSLVHLDILKKKWLQVIFSQKKTKKKTSLAALYLADVLLDILIACLLNNNGQILLGDLRYDQ